MGHRGCARGYRRGRAVKETKASLLLTLGLSAYSSADIGMGPIIVPASPGLLQLPQGILKIPKSDALSFMLGFIRINCWKNICCDVSLFILLRKESL